MRTKDDAVKESKNEQPSGGSSVSAGGSYSKSSGSSGSSSSKSNSAGKGSASYGAANAGVNRSAGGSPTAARNMGGGGTRSSGNSSRAAQPGSAPAWVGQNPYQWGNTSGTARTYTENDPARQQKANALGFAYNDPDRSFHYYTPPNTASASYLEQANQINQDRNRFMYGQFWNTMNRSDLTDEEKKQEAYTWMQDAQIYGNWAKENNFKVTTEDGQEHDMGDLWKEAWSYANELTGGIGYSDQERAGRDIDAYLNGKEFDSATTQRLLDQATQFMDSAESRKEKRQWEDYRNALQTQLEADQKKENRSWLGKAWDSVTGAFQRPEREEQGELTDTQKAYQQAAADEQMYAGYATDPLSAESFAPLAEKRDELAEAVKTENREAGREVYAGMMPEDRMADATESWLGGRGAGTAAGVAGGMYAVDSMFYDNDEIRELTQRKFIADQNLLTTGDQKYREESEALQAQIDEAQQRANENGENGTVLGDAAGMLLESARGMQGEADQKWQDVTEDLSEAEKFGLNVAKTGADVTADIAENAVAPGVGTMRMYLGAAGSGAMEQAGRENNDPDSIAANTLKNAASAWLSTKLVGGMESAYGQSILGGITEQAFANASPSVQAAAKTLLNTEGVEEGLEDILNYAGDLILGLDEEAQLSWDEVKQDALVGYVLGVLTNGLSAGINYNSKARHALAEEAVEFVQSDLSIEEAAEIGKESTKEDIVMKPGKPAADETQGQTTTEPQAAEPQGADAMPQDTGVASEVTPESTTNAGVEEAAAEPQETTPAAAPAQTASGPAADSTAYTGPELPNATYGGGSTVKVGNTKVPVHFAVVPIGELNVSHDIYGNENTNYPSELQPRDRSRGTAQAQAMNIGNNLDPGELEWSNNATTGAPIIRPDGVVISGNGRTLGISYALQNGKGEDYIQHIRDNAARFGIDPNSVGEDSVLVRVADGDYNWQAMAEQANVSDVSRMNASEQARVDAERLSRYPEILDKLVPNDTGDLRTGENADFVKEFLQAVVPESEQGDVWTQDGGLSKNGLTRVQNAVFQMAYGDPSLMARLSESLDNNMKNVSNSLLALAPKVANLETSVENGTRYIGVRDVILDGVKIFETAKNRGVDVQKVVDQISLDNNAGAEAVFIAEFLQDNAKSAKQIRTFLNAMADTAESFGDPSQVGFFDTGDTEYTSKDVLEGAIAKYEQETGNQLRRPDYDFYGDGGDLLDVGTDRESESRNPEEPDAATDRAAAGAGEDTGNGAGRGEVSELARRMEAGKVSEDEYMALLQSEDGRAQLADALSLPNSDMKTVVDGLSLYLILQERYQTMLAEQQQGTQNTAETATGAQETFTGVNSRADETNATEGTLNTQNAQENANPFFETEENADTGSQNVNQNADNVNENANTGNQNQNQNVEQEQTTGKKRVTNRGNPNENTDADFDALNERYGSIEQGENPARDINVPRKDIKGRKVGEGARTIFEAEATPESRLGNLKAAVVNGDLSHVTVTNDARSERAVKTLATNGWKKSVGEFLSAVEAGKSDADTIALGAHLLNEAGNATEASGRDYIELAMAYNEAMTRAGQGLAAGRILKTLTPEGKLYGFEKTVEKINKGIREKNEKRAPGRQKAEVKLNEELTEQYLNAKTEEERNAIHDQMVKDIAQQIPNTLRDKFTALRYLNMLGNFKTQVRNVVGNVGMTAVQKTKNEVVSMMEGIAEVATGGKVERQYKGLYGADRLRAARADFASDADIERAAKGEAKYADVGKQATAEINDAKDPFSNRNPLGKFLNLYSKATNAAMDYGDLIFVRANYADALAGYMNAHGISAQEWTNMVSDPNRATEVDKARNYAIKQAQEATFRDTNAVSEFVSKMDSNWKKPMKAVAQGVIPFRKTPANVMVRMEEYSPLGIANTIVKGVQAKNGNASVNEVIDSAAKTLTGSGLAMLGWALRKSGLLRTKDKDEKEEALAKLRGQQDYSVEFTLPSGERRSFTLDWLTPASGSLFMGSELFDLVRDGTITWADAYTALTTLTNPMMEMSMLSGVNDALDNLSDFEGDNSAMVQFVLNSAWSYLTQGISNTLLGQAEQFSEDYRQTYYTDPDNPFLTPSIQKKLAKFFNKTPGRDYQAADYIDAWGRKQENDENLLERGFNVFLNPGYVSNMDEKATEADDIIESLYRFGQKQDEKDSFPNVVPQTPSRSTTVNGTKLTPEEYDVYAQAAGQEKLRGVTEFAQSDLFGDMDEYAQAETISDIYSYASFLAASRIAEMRGEEYYNDTYSPLISGEKENGENTYKAPIDEEDIPEYLAFRNAYDSALTGRDYDAVDALLDSASDLSQGARTGAMQRAPKMEILSDLRDAGLSSTKVYYQFQNDMQNIYESEKRVAPKSSDYIRAAGSGKYSDDDADAIMNYERSISEQTAARYQDQIRYNLEQAGLGGAAGQVWNMVQSVADGEMTKDQFKSYVDSNVPARYRQAIKDVASNYTEDKHVAGKTVSGIYRAVRDTGGTPKQALEFYNMIDANYNGSFTKKELDAACRQAYGNSDTGRRVRSLLKEYIGK